MRLAVDTNVLLRVILRDDPQQAIKAEALLDRADPIVISVIVLCELSWVLAGAQKFSATEIHDIMARLVATRTVEVDRPVVEAGLRMLAQGGGFADGCILAQAGLARCEALATFDRALIALGQPIAAHPVQIA